MQLFVRMCCSSSSHNLISPPRSPAGASGLLPRIRLSRLHRGCENRSPRASELPVASGTMHNSSGKPRQPLCHPSRTTPAPPTAHIVHHGWGEEWWTSSWSLTRRHHILNSLVTHLRLLGTLPVCQKDCYQLLFYHMGRYMMNILTGWVVMPGWVSMSFGHCRSLA